MANFFVYGSLMAEEVLTALIGRVPPFSAARLNGFLRYSIEGKHYPIILPSEHHTDAVAGSVLLGITTSETSILDHFEGDEYERVEVTVHTENKDDVKAFTYVISKPSRQLLSDKLSPGWSYQEFRDRNLASFLRMHCGAF